MTGVRPAGRIRKRTTEAGVASIEFVLVFPVLLLLFFGLINLSHYTTASLKLSQSAALMADLVTRGDSVIGSDFTDFYIAVDMEMTPLPTTNLRIEVYNFYRTGGVTMQRWKKSSPNGKACAPPDLNAPPISTLLSDNPRDVVVAVTCMPYVPPVPDFPGLAELFRNMTITRSIALQPRSSSKITCPASDCNG